jgi:vitamin B12 transporter
LQARLSHWQSQGTTDYLDFFGSPLDQDYRSATSALSLDASPAERWDSRLNLSYFSDEIDQNQSPDFAHTYRSRLDWQNDLIPGRIHQLTAGLTYTRERTRSLSFGTGYDEVLRNLDLYLQDSLALDQHQMTLGASLVHNEEFGNHATWSLAWGYDLSPESRLRASAASAFRAPNSADLYGFGGNPDLDPETSRGFELGLRQGLGPDQELTASLFYTRIDDLIEFVDPDDFLGPEPGRNYNVDEARIYGLELGYGYQQGPWRLQLDGVLQNPENRRILDDGGTLVGLNPETGHVKMGFEMLPAAFSLVAMERRLAHTHWNSQPDGNYDQDNNIGVVNIHETEALLYALWAIGYKEYCGIDINPENMPAPFVRNAGNPTFKAGLFSLFILLSERILTIVIQ